MKILIESVKHASQRYSTVGDWFVDPDGTIRILVSDMGNDDYNFLVGLHELVEFWLCKKRNIHEKSVTGFDVEFEARRGIGDLSEPGDDINAPYRDEHCFATGIEKLMCSALHIPWKTYEETVERL